MKIKIEEVELSQKDFSLLMNVSRETIRIWESKGMPSIKRGKYVLWDCFQWWRKNIAVDPNETTLTEERKLKIQVERKLKELEYLLETKELIPWNEVENEFVGRVGIVTQGLMSLHRILPRLLYGKEPREMADIIKNHVIQLRNKYAGRSGVFASSSRKNWRKKKN